MKPLFKIGDKKTYQKLITDEDSAAFHGENVHPVCSTFALARDIEWTSRQFVLDLKDQDEEGIGTQLTIDHQTPALIGESIDIEATIEKMQGNELLCSYTVKAGERLIATGKTGQKILKIEFINKLFQSVKQHD